MDCLCEDSLPLLLICQLSTKHNTSFAIADQERMDTPKLQTKWTSLKLKYLLVLWTKEWEEFLAKLYLSIPLNLTCFHNPLQRAE